jgi:hypothetical protein
MRQNCLMQSPSQRWHEIACRRHNLEAVARCRFGLILERRRLGDELENARLFKRRRRTLRKVTQNIVRRSNALFRQTRAQRDINAAHNHRDRFGFHFPSP